MFPFMRKQAPIYQAPKNHEVKSLDTSAAEARSSLSLTTLLPVMPDPMVDWIDAEKFQEVERAVRDCPIAQRCVDTRADKLSSVAVKVSGGPMGQLLLESPNARHKTLSQNVYMWTNDLTLTGELWLMLDMSIRGRPQLFRARPDLLERDPQRRMVTYDDGRLTGKKNPSFRFHYDESGDCTGCEELVGGKWTPYPAYLIRIWHHNPASDAAGKGSCRSILRSIRAWLDLQELLAKNIKRGGPRHAATLKGTAGLSDADFATLQSRIQASAAASANAMLVIPEAQLVATGSSFTELNLPEIKKALEWDILCGLSIQPAMVGVEDQVEYAAQRGAEAIFYKTWVKPEAEWLFAELQAALRMYLNEPLLTIEIDDANLTFTEMDRMERARAYRESGVATTNEIRAQLGLAPVPGGDTVPGVSAGNDELATAAQREADRLLGTQSDAERALDALTKPREVSLYADTSQRPEPAPSDTTPE